MTSSPARDGVDPSTYTSSIVEIKPSEIGTTHSGSISAEHTASAQSAFPIYWAVVTDEHALKAAERLGRGSGRVRTLDSAAVSTIGFAFEGDLPMSMDDLHAVGVLVGTTVVVCAAERRHLAAVPDCQLTLSPTQLPDFVRAVTGNALEPTQFNLLQAEFEPAVVRNARSKVWTAVTAAACIAMLLVAAGLWRRASAWSAEAATRAKATETIGDRMFPGERLSVADAVRRGREELVDLGALQSLVEAPSKQAAQDDCAVTLASLLSQWPKSTAGEGESFQTEVLSLTDSSISATVLTSADARGFLDQLRAPEGWTMQQPRLSQSPSGVRLAVQMTRAKVPTPVPSVRGTP